MAVRSMRWWAAGAALFLGFATLAVATGMAVASSGSVTRQSTWSQVRTFSGLVTDIASAGRRDAWLSGFGTDNKVFVQRWNGARWRAVRTPGAMFTDEDAIVGASSATNAWVFTFTRPAVSASYAVGWHWTGRAWRSYRLPGGTSIDATAVFRRADAWAFGMIGARKPYVIRYDGRHWRRVHAPVQPAGASALSGHDIWIVGPTTGRLGTSLPSYEAADWTGKSWRTLKLPHARVPKGMYVASSHILAVGPANIWIDFGLFSNSAQAPDAQILLHYDAGQWTQVSVAHGSVFGSSVLAADGRGGIWLALATARKRLGSELYDYRNGNWSKGAVLAKPGHYTVITSMTRVPGTRRTWAGGYSGYTAGAPRTDGALYEFRR
jgi:hypothetical protein